MTSKKIFEPIDPIEPSEPKLDLPIVICFINVFHLIILKYIEKEILPHASVNDIIFNLKNK